MARGFGHRGDLPKPVEVPEQRGVGPQMLVVEVECNVSQRLNWTTGVAHLSEAQLGVLEKLVQRLRTPRSGDDVGLGYEGQRAIGHQAKVPKAHWLGPMHHQGS